MHNTRKLWKLDIANILRWQTARQLCSQLHFGSQINILFWTYVRNMPTSKYSIFRTRQDSCQSTTVHMQSQIFIWKHFKTILKMLSKQMLAIGPLPNALSQKRTQKNRWINDIRRVHNAINDDTIHTWQPQLIQIIVKLWINTYHKWYDLHTCSGPLTTHKVT